MFSETFFLHRFTSSVSSAPKKWNRPKKCYFHIVFNRIVFQSYKFWNKISETFFFLHPFTIEVSSAPESIQKMLFSHYMQSILHLKLKILNHVSETFFFTSIYQFGLIRTGIDPKNVIFTLYSIESSFKVTHFETKCQKLFFTSIFLRSGIDPKNVIFTIYSIESSFKVTSFERNCQKLLFTLNSINLVLKMTEN